MTNRFRPTHCNFGSLRHAGERIRQAGGYHNFAGATNEQLSARALDRSSRVSRPALVFADFREA